MTDPARVSPADARALLDEGYVFVDVRSVPEFEQEHPAGAFNVPLMNLGPGGMTQNAEFLSVMTACFPISTKLVLGCKTGQRSMRAARMLLERGYAEVVDQRAGMAGAHDPFGQIVEAGWKSAGLPTATGDGGDRSYRALRSRVSDQT